MSYKLCHKNTGNQISLGWAKEFVERNTITLNI